MNFYSKSQMENELNIQKKNLELLNLLEKKCEGLENLLCKNVINTISKKIETIERDFPAEPDNKTTNDYQNKGKIIRKNADDNITMLNENLDIIENSFKYNLTSKDSQFSDTIRKKVEENYMLLNELEKTNRPIFTKTTEINNTIFVENKIKEMDDKLSVLFKSDNAKSYSARNIDVYTNHSNNYTNKSPRTVNYEKVNDTDYGKKENDPANEKINVEKEREIRKKELYGKLITTEKRIKEIAGNLLKNF
ncbi:MAG: hypothetical protein NTU73_04480 [Ignavibacteriae bacterium]|nr:hypothetical protein [Ignavibacteriota bacterium]